MEENEDKEIEEQEIVLEDEDESINPEAQIKKLREKLKASEAKAAEYLDGWQRMKADFVNARKRDEERAKEIRTFANEGLIEELLPVLDSFEMAMGNKEAWEKADKNWRVGVEYIYNHLLETLKKNGIEVIDPLGEKFDPKRDTPTETISTDNPDEDGKIVVVLSKGYILNGKEIRSPRVKVAEYKK